MNNNNFKEKGWITTDTPAYFNKDLRYSDTTDFENGKVEKKYKPIMIPYSDEHRALADKVEYIDKTGDWLEDAVLFNIFKLESKSKAKIKQFNNLINHLYTELEQIIKMPNRKRYRDALKMVIINLTHAYVIGKAVKYSRNRSSYTGKSRYGKLFIKYDRLIPIIDGLETLEYIKQKNGYWNEGKGCGRTTRMWASPRLTKHFHNYNLKQLRFYSKARPVDVIVINEDIEVKHKNNRIIVKKKEISLPNTPEINLMRKDIVRYNNCISKHQISVDIDSSVQVSYEFLANFLFQNILSNSININQIKPITLVNNNTISNTVDLQRPVIQLFSNNIQDNIITEKHIRYPYHLLTNINTITKRFFPNVYEFIILPSKKHIVDNYENMFINYLTDLSYSISMNPNKERREAYLKEVFQLKDIGVEHMVLQLSYEYLHRVFNKGSIEYGGRAYGALHQRIPKHLRKYIRINGQPTVQLDYKALHILMLYHNKKIDYQDDPYLVCEGPEMRNTYKAVGLVAINAENAKKANGGIYDELKHRGIPLPKRKKPIQSLLQTFQEAHMPISNHLYSDAGKKLQNLDGQIMNAILMRLLDEDILGLPVFDSVIVDAQYEDILRQVMIDEYIKVMGFEPGISKEN